MNAVGVYLRSELRARWKALAGIALLLGIAGGAVVASAAGARRTATAYDRFLVAQNAADVSILDDGELGLTAKLDDVIALPQVASHARGSLIFYVLNDHSAVASVDDRIGRTINRFKVLSGRMYHPDRANEIVVGFAVARRLRLKTGSTFPLIEPNSLDEAAKEGIRNITLKVVGIVAGPGEFPPQYIGLYPSIHLTPAFFRTYGNRLGSHDASLEQGTLFLKLKRGVADIEPFRHALTGLNAGSGIAPSAIDELSVGTKRTFHFQSVGLWFLAGFGALATILIGGQALARQAFLGSAEFPTLSALGLERGQLFFVGLLRAGLVGLASAGVAAVVAYAASPLTPIGDARLAEPHAGLAFDATAIGFGAVGLALATLTLAAIPAWRTARIRAARSPGEDHGLRRSRVAGALTRATLPVSGAAGVRLALETGRGRTAVPVRSTILGAAFGVAVLIAATTFGASLDHLVASPALYGAGWDAFLTHYGDGPDMRENGRRMLGTPGITDVTVGSDLPLVIGERPVLGFGLLMLRGNAGPPIVAGRAPRAPNEIALATKTARRIHAPLGQKIKVRVHIDGAPTASFTFVGRTVIAPFGFADTEPGEGALMTSDGLLRLIPAEFRDDPSLFSDAMVRLAPGADREAVIRSVAPFFGRAPEDFGEGPHETPADVISFGRVQNLPLILGTILGIVAAATLAHTVASSVRRRRNDLAILKTLGFERRQLRATVAWQATVLVLASLVIGVPGGIALGRWLWLLLADQISVVPKAVIPVATAAAVIPAAILLANLIAAVPARAAARLRPATVLRTE